MSATLKLSAPLRAIDREFAELSFRPPTGADLVKSGMPFRYVGESIVVEPKPMSILIGQLAGVPLSSVEAMPALDFLGGCAVIMDFLSPSAPTSSTDTLRSDAGGAAPSTSSN